MIAVSMRLIRPQRRDHDRHIIDFDRLDDPRLDDGRNLVGRRIDLVVDLDQRVFAIFADVESHRDDALSRLRHRVDEFDTIDLVQQFFQSIGDLSFDLFGRQSRCGGEHVGHRDDDLRFFLTRCQEQRRRAEHQRNDDQQDRDVTTQKDLDDPCHQRCVGRDWLNR